MRLTEREVYMWRSNVINSGNRKSTAYGQSVIFTQTGREGQTHMLYSKYFNRWEWLILRVFKHDDSNVPTKLIYVHEKFNTKINLGNISGYPFHNILLPIAHLRVKNWSTGAVTGIISLKNKLNYTCDFTCFGSLGPTTTTSTNLKKLTLSTKQQKTTNSKKRNKLFFMNK